MTRCSRDSSLRRVRAVVTALPSLPEVVLRLQRVLQDPASGARDVAECLESDPGLASRLLRLANSALYGFSGRISSIPQAVALIGYRSLWVFAFTAGFVDVIRPHVAGALDPTSFWRHAVRTALAARRLAGRAGSRDPGEAYVAGLLHDIGVIALLMACPGEYAGLLRSRPGGHLLPEDERRLLGIHHGEAGAELCGAWRLPAPLGHVVRYLHDAPSDPPDRDLLLVVSLAESLATTEPGDACPPEATSLAGQALRELPALGNWEVLVAEVEADAREVKEVLRLFSGPGPRGGDARPGRG